MKKIYLAPETLSVTIATQSLIANSLDSLNVNKSGESVSKGNAWTKDQGSWGDIWDSDDDE